jgi:hypothetical protein
MHNDKVVADLLEFLEKDGLGEAGELPSARSLGASCFHDQTRSPLHPQRRFHPTEPLCSAPCGRGVTEVLISTGVNSPRTAGTCERFCAATLKAFAPSEPPEKITFLAGGSPCISSLKRLEVRASANEISRVLVWMLKERISEGLKHERP